MKKKRKAPALGGARVILSEEAESCLHIAYNAILYSMKSEDVAAAIYFLQNGLEWIDELPGKPDGWDDMDPDIKAYFRGMLTDAAELTVGSKAVDRYYRQTVLGYSDREFEDLWQSAQIKLLHYEFDKCNGNGKRRNNKRNYRCSTQKSITAFLVGFILGGFLSILLSLLFKIVLVL